MKPILFNTEMVRAILEGRKTQTRRVVKAKGCRGKQFIPPSNWTLEQILEWVGECPYGKVGDVLWVRETWSYSYDYDNGGLDKTEFYYKANHAEFNPQPDRWKPSIHMPFEAARIFLEITNIRVERLQDISNLDSINEGIEYLGTGDYGPEWKCYFDIQSGTVYTLPILSFASLWKSINGEDSWNSNPWVWVVEFKRIEKP